MGGDEKLEERDIPKLEHYTPTKQMAPGSHYDKRKADMAVAFIEQLRHTKGKWAGKRFWLLPWQEQIIRDLFGIVKEDGCRQFREAFIECSKKSGKSELAAAVALLLLYLDNEPSAEIMGAACDRSQASLVFDVACRQVEMCPPLLKRSKILKSSKKIINLSNNGYYKVVSADLNNKAGANLSGVIFDEIYNQPDDKLYQMLVRGASDVRTQPLAFEITTAGFDINSFCYQLHGKAKDIQAGKIEDPAFYGAVFSLDEGDDWREEKNWYKSNPSLGVTVPLDRMRDAYKVAQENPSEENFFKVMRLNMWTNASVAWLPDNVFMKGAGLIDMESLKGRLCYGGLDLSTTTDISALSLMFPPDDPHDPDQKYVLLCYFWLPEETVQTRFRHAGVKYPEWAGAGYLDTTPGNVIDYQYIKAKVMELSEIYQLQEIAADPWNATQFTQELEQEGFTIVPMRQGYASLSDPTKSFYRLMMEGRIQHGANPVLRWMASNVIVDQDAAGNIKPTKAKSIEKIDGIVSSIMALDRCIRNEGKQISVYNSRGILFL